MHNCHLGALWPSGHELCMSVYAQLTRSRSQLTMIVMFAPVSGVRRRFRRAGRPATIAMLSVVLVGAVTGCTDAEGGTADAGRRW
jgi:hypothetical protein